MANSIHGHISYILETNSKRLISKKRQEIENEVADLYSFLTKIFHNI